MRDETDGKTMWSTGSYRGIKPNQRIICTDFLCDSKGEPIDPNGAGEWTKVSIIDVTFESRGENRMQLELKHEGIPSEMHDDCVDGWSTSIDKFQKVVERN